MVFLVAERIKLTMKLKDNGDRRFGIDRRQFSYFVHIPERRSGRDRRSGFDRRMDKGGELEKEKERRGFYQADLIL